MNTWTLTVQQDPQSHERFLQFPKDLLKKVKWKEGDTIEWINNKDGSWSLKKINQP